MGWFWRKGGALRVGELWVCSWGVSLLVSKGEGVLGVFLFLPPRGWSGRVGLRWWDCVSWVWLLKGKGCTGFLREDRAGG